MPAGGKPAVCGTTDPPPNIVIYIWWSGWWVTVSYQDAKENRWVEIGRYWDSRQLRFWSVEILVNFDWVIDFDFDLTSISISCLWKIRQPRRWWWRNDDDDDDDNDNATMTMMFVRNYSKEIDRVVAIVLVNVHQKFKLSSRFFQWIEVLNDPM